MDNVWLICNPRSKSYDDQVVADIEQLFFEAGRPVGRLLVVGQDNLPDGRVARMAGVQTIIVLSGDGTINAAAESLEDWTGDMLVLPGGTMNMLSGSLHGDRTPVEIVQDVLAGKARSAPVPVIEGPGVRAYCGIIAGPSSAWADVREDLRDLDLKAVAADAAQAVTATFEEPGVRLKGADTEFPAIFMEPAPGRIDAYGVLASSAGDLVAHGWAWLRGDFRDGPSERLGARESIALASEAEWLDILVDGEPGKVSNAAEFRAATSKLHFLSTRQAGS